MANMLGGKPNAAPVLAAAPTVTPPPTMPDPMSPAALEARRQAQGDAGRGGRQSTILTTAMSRAGGGSGAYGSAKLGSSM